ncbi:MAG: hypothetical protein RL684_525 [Pseudomonadota bacterium]
MHERWPMSLRARIFLAFAGTMLLGFGALAWWIVGDLRARYSESFEEIMVDGSRLLAQQLAADWQQPAAQRFAPLRAAMERLGRERFSAPIYSITKTSADIRVYVTDAAGRLLYDSSPGSQPGDDYSGWHDVGQVLHGAYGARTTAEPITDEYGQTITIGVAYVAAPIMVNGDLVGVVSLGKPKTNSQRFLDSARRKVLAAVLLSAAAVGLIALLLYAWVSRPLQALVEYAQEVSEGRPVQLPPLGENEIGRVGLAIEGMRTALQGKQYVEGYVQSLTHEIKSPLTAIRASAELLAGDLPAGRRQGFVATIEREVDRLSQLADRLLELATLERADRLAHVGDVSLQALVGDLSAAAAPVAAARGVQVRLHDEPGTAVPATGPATVRGDALLLRQAIDNLLRNALDFAPAGSTIKITVAALRAGVQVEVRDHGPGIPAFARERIFERFYSLPRPASGAKSTGLGLNFVREVAHLHGGQVTIDCPGPGEGNGTRARLVIPWRWEGN